MPSPLFVVGLSHHTAPVEVRERVAFPENIVEDTARKLAALAGGEAMVVSTCNRVELYLAPQGSSGAGGAADVASLRARIEQFLATAGAIDAGALAPLLYVHNGDAAVRHLFRVAASLDSIVVGEPQILGQVKTAFEAARRAGTVGATLERTVQRAFAVAKRVRSETAIARSSASVASAAVELARHIFGKLDGKDMMVLGAGKMAELATRHLQSAGCRRLLVLNRTLARAQALAERQGGEAHPWEQMEALMAKVDIVLCSTGAPRPVVSREMVARVMKARRGRWLCFIDIAVPRDVETAVGEIDNVYLYDVDELTQLVDVNMSERRREAEAAERIVDGELQRFASAEKTLGLGPTIKALRDRCLEIARAEAERTAGKLGGGDGERRAVTALAEAIVNKLLHAPMTALKREAESEALLHAARTLFALEEQQHQAEGGGNSHRHGDDGQHHGRAEPASATAGRADGARANNQKA